MTGLGDKICACIVERNAAERAKLLQRFPFCELRSDLCNLSPEDLSKDLELIQTLSEQTGLKRKVIVALRNSPEKTLTPQEADNLIAAAVKGGADYIDLDLGVIKLFFQRGVKCSWANIRKESKTSLIVSYHNYKSTPAVKELQSILDNCVITGERFCLKTFGSKWKRKLFVKIATTAKKMEDAQRVMDLYKFPVLIEKERLIAIAMGEAGAFTRVSALNLGAPFTYCKAKEESASGQYTYNQMLGYLEPKAAFAVEDFALPKGFPITSKVAASKSLAQRALLISSYASQKIELKNFAPYSSIALKDLIPFDTLSALNFVKKSGAVVKTIKNKEGERTDISICSKGIWGWKKIDSADCSESALLARSLIALCAVTGVKFKIEGSGTLLKRDFSSSVRIIEENGGKCSYIKKNGKAFLPLTVEKKIQCNEINIDGSTTSQDITGYLMALPLNKEGGKIVASNTVSTSYIDLTIKTMEELGVEVQNEIGVSQNGIANSFKIKPNSSYKGGTIFLDNDWSSAANLLVDSAIESYACQGKEVPAVDNMTLDSLESDELIMEVLTQCGCTMTFFNSPPNVVKGTGRELYDINLSVKHLRGFDVDCTDSPDLIPILCTLAYFCSTRSKIKGVHRLINKESNRAASILMEFNRLHCRIKIKDDCFIIDGGAFNDLISASDVKVNRHPKGEAIQFCSHNDHRIALALIILARHLNIKATLDNIDCINKSWRI